MPGRYTTIVADYEPISTLYTTISPSICSFGILGTRYSRLTAAPSSIEIYANMDFATFTIAHISSELSIGNVLAISLRQKAGHEHSFVTFADSATETAIIIDSSQTTVGVYTLELESFDGASTIQSTLATDTVTVTVVPGIPTAPWPEVELTADQPQTWTVAAPDIALDQILSTNIMTTIPLTSDLFSYDYHSNTMSYLGTSDTIKYGGI